MTGLLTRLDPATRSAPSLLVGIAGPAMTAAKVDLKGGWHY
jgi:hypothetical protein